MKKKAIILNYYRWWQKRQAYFADWLIDKGYDVLYITADYDHISKSYTDGDINPPYVKKIHVPSYKRNLSIKRIISNYCYCKEVSKCLIEEKPNVVVALTPTNFLGIPLKKYRKINKNAIIVDDILDMWPESLPISNTLKKLAFIPFAIWKHFRKQAISASNVIILECNLFYETIKNELKGKDTHILYLQKSNNCFVTKKVLEEKIHFVYIGSINDIIDIDKMIYLLSEINKQRKVTLDIIGCGSNENYFVEQAKEHNIQTQFYGAIFDENCKHEIYEKCHFGLNVMKENVVIGLTTKSMDYFESSLPILNSVPYDSSQLVTKYNAGVNIEDGNEKQVIDYFVNLTQEEYDSLQNGAVKLFKENFMTTIFKKHLDEILKEYIK